MAWALRAVETPQGGGSGAGNNVQTQIAQAEASGANGSSIEQCPRGDMTSVHGLADINMVFGRDSGSHKGRGGAKPWAVCWRHIPHIVQLWCNKETVIFAATTQSLQHRPWWTLGSELTLSTHTMPSTKHQFKHCWPTKNVAARCLSIRQYGTCTTPMWGLPNNEGGCLNLWDVMRLA